MKGDAFTGEQLIEGLPAKHDDDEVQLFYVDTEDPETLDEFLDLFGASLMKHDSGSYTQDPIGTFIVHTVTNGMYVRTMLGESDLCDNIRNYGENE